MGRRVTRINPGWQQVAHLYPHRADTPADFALAEGDPGFDVDRGYFPWVLPLRDGQTKRWAFRRRSDRDRFVAGCKDRGARNAR